MSLTIIQTRLVLASLLGCILLLCSCERATRAKVEGGNPPIFVIWAGTGRFWHISITEYLDDKSLKPSQRSRELWRVDANRRDSAKYPSTIGKIVYGIVPAGYHQLVPSSGAPPALLPGKSYSYRIASENGMPAIGDFEIRNGVAVSVKREYACYYVEDGKEIEIPCGRR